MEDGRVTLTREGVPQGGVISPVIMNVALHGMEQAAGVRYWEGGATLRAVPGTPVLVRYADDLAVLCATRAQAEQVKARLAGWLEPRGLAFNEAKTRIVHLSQGFDFLGFSIRRYPNGKLLTKPSKEAMRRIRKRLSTEAIALRGANADALIARLNPIITGWAAYYRIGVSKRAYGTLDAHLWRLAWKWAKFSHPNKPRRWIITRHFGMFNPARQDKWVFGSRETGFYLRKFAWTKIVRHRMVAGRASPDDPALTGYWQQRRRRDRLPVDPATWHLLRRQRGRCPLCRGLLLHADHQPQEPGGMAAVAHRHAQGDPQARDRQRDGPRHPGRTRRIPPHTRTLPPPHRQRHQPGASARPAAFRACLSRAARKAGTAGSEGTPARQRAGVTRRAVVRLLDRSDDPPGRAQERASPRSRHPRLDRELEPESPALQMGQDRRRDPGLTGKIYIPDFRRGILVPHQATFARSESSGDEKAPDLAPVTARVSATAPRSGRSTYGQPAARGKWPVHQARRSGRA